MMRRYTGKWHRFDQPDPYDGSYDMTDPQSFNRYSYVQNDPVNSVDPTGLEDCGRDPWCIINIGSGSLPGGAFGVGAGDGMVIEDGAQTPGGVSGGQGPPPLPQNPGQTPTGDFTKPDCLPQPVKDAFKDAWKKSGYGFQQNSEYSFAIAQNSTTGALTTTSPKSTHEFSAGALPVVPAIIAGAHTHGPGDLPGLSETDKNSAIKGGIAMYVMSRNGGLSLYDPANKATQKSRRDINNPNNDYAYGIKVGEVLGKNAFWDKACK